MTTWRVCLLSLVAVCCFGRCAAFPISTPEETSTPKPVSFDYSAERHIGKYTGEWEPNTLISFDRVLAVIEYSYLTGVERLVNFADELSDEELDEVRNKPFDMKTLTVRALRYARDFRTKKTQQDLGSSRFYFLEIENTNERPGEYTYPNNTEIVWQIAIPEDHVAVVALTSISLEKPQDGSCINDFVSVYTDNEVPDKFCSTLEQIRQLKPNGSERLTVKFQSNEADNLGRFAGAVWILHNSTVFNQKRRRRDASLTIAEEPTPITEEPIPIFEERFEELMKGDDLDIPEVEEAVTCLVHIAKYGDRAAAQYLASHNANCKEMAEVFFDRKY